MGYACPVCGAEQADAVHLAHHLGVTASLGRADHREWLAEHAPSWADSGPEELAEVVAPHAPEVDTPEFDDHAHGHEGGRPSFEDELARQAGSPGRGGPAGTGRAGSPGGASGEVQGVLEEARELTRQMHESEDDPDADSSPEADAEDVASSSGAEADDAGSTERTDADGRVDDGSADDREENA